MDIVTSIWPRLILDVSPYSKICSIEVISNKYISKKIQFIRSAGSRGLLLDNKYKNFLSIIVLPSLKIKILSNRSIVFLNYIENELYKYQKPQKAGYYINKGKKPTVRGIVKNPCDHPNGGRTRTILLSRTPWGKIAKKSRKRIYL
jgi:large subunit ribosomal protein L2